MSELVRRYSELRRERAEGRHAFDEDAALTPIFHALHRGGGPDRGQNPPARDADEVDEFRRDPLTAPIPIQAFAAAAVPSLPRARRQAPAEPHRAGGRHHYRLETAGAW